MPGSGYTNKTPFTLREHAVQDRRQDVKTIVASALTGTRSIICCCAMLMSLAGQLRPAQAGTHIWSKDPTTYPIIDPDAVADGVITYDVDMSGFNLWANRQLTLTQILQLNDAVCQAFDKWNEVIAPLGLQFRQAAIGELSELSVRAVPYNNFVGYFGQSQDSVALALAWPYKNLYNILPIWIDSGRPFTTTHDAPLIADQLLSQPYITIVDTDQFDIYATIMHEIGHVVGLGHVADAIRGRYNYNFLANMTVEVDASSLAHSQWVSGMPVDKRRPILETELYTLMIPLRQAYPNEIPPDDRATVAFTLRNINPAGADEILAEARRLYEKTSPLRFPNVVYELEKNDDNDRNNTPETAMPIKPNQVIIASLFGEDINGNPPDSDCYRLDLSDTPAGTRLYLDIDEAAGLLDIGATKVALTLLDEDGQTVAEGGPVGDPPDADSYSPDDPILLYTLKTPGVYYIQVAQAEDGQVGTYVLKVGVGKPAEPTGNQTPPIDTAGAGTPAPMHKSLLDGLCPGIGFTTLALGLMGLWILKGRTEC